MATKIVTKNSSTASAAPTASDLVQGELAVNVTDKRLFTENASGAIVELGVNPLGAVTMASTLNVTGVLTATDINITDTTPNLKFTDTDGTHLANITQSGSHLYVDNDSTGNIRFRVDSNTERLTVNPTGIAVVGEITATSLDISGDIDVDGTANLDIVDVDGAVNFAADVTFADGADIITASAGTSNVRFGVNAGNSIVSGGNYNTVVGDEAGTAVTTGIQNTAVGYSAGAAITTGEKNVTIGYNSGKLITTGVKNVAVGSFSLDATTTGENNVAIGQSALGKNTTADDNVAVGKDSLTNNTTGASNTAVGTSALNTNTTASNNTALGKSALGANTTGSNNTAVGKAALDACSVGVVNTALGADALSAETKGSRSVAIGAGALEVQNFTSATNTNNVAVGFNAGGELATGTNNTFVGALCGDNNDDGAGNTAVGHLSLSANAGDQNTAVGDNSLGVVTGSNNTAIGRASGLQITSGGNNIAIGLDALRSGSPGGAQTTASNKIGLGDENISSAHIQVDWTVASDARDKADFTALDLGLDFVKALAPVTYKWDKRSKYGDKTADGYDLAAQSPDGTHKEDWLDIGFKAQEVEALEIAAGYNKSSKTNLVSSHTADGKQMGLQYSKFVPILVKAIQEQNALIEALTARIVTLEG